MSFAGDAGLDPTREKVYESEGAFHLSNKTGDLRSFWKNALGIVIDFWTRVPNASVMGLQEMNNTVDGTRTGSAEVESAVKATVASRSSPFKVGFVTMEVITPVSKPALMLIWNASKLGVESKRAISDLDYVPGEEAVEEIDKSDGSKVKKSGKQSGRPILMVMTKGGYLLINCHAPNHAELSAKTLADLRAALNSKISEFVGNEVISEDKIFLMGDFNDRYDALQRVSLSVGDSTYNLKYNGKAPLSCCHNWDSSCTESRYKALPIAGREKVGTCDPEGQPLAGPGPRKLMEIEGNIENYRYYGDKVFGANPVDNIQMYPSGRQGPSTESDHEMVIATFETVTTGGRNKNKQRKTQKKSRRKSRKTRRY